MLRAPGAIYATVARIRDNYDIPPCTSCVRYATTRAVVAAREGGIETEENSKRKRDNDGTRAKG